MKTISDTYFDLERELYNTHDICLINCHFQGLNDGESPLKECCNVHLFNCDFDLRYPLWHDKNIHAFSFYSPYKHNSHSLSVKI